MITIKKIKENHVAWLASKRKIELTEQLEKDTLHAVAALKEDYEKRKAQIKVPSTGSIDE